MPDLVSFLDDLMEGEMEDGWIEWKGGQCPVDDECIVDVIFRCDHDFRGKRAGDLHWHHDGEFDDITEYRVAKP